MKKNFILLLLVSLAYTGFSQTIYFQEGFDNGLPATWTASAEWTFGTPAAASSQFFTVPAADGNVACFNDDGLGNGAVGGGEIVTGEIDLSAVTGTVVLEMNSFFPNLDYGGNDETAIIAASSDGGANWTDLADLAGGEGADFGVVFADISSYAGGSIWLRFTYDDGQTWNYGWAMDNITIADQITLVSPRSFALHAGGSVMIDQAVEGVEYKNSGYIINSGLEEITSYDIELSNGTDVITQSFSGVSIPYNSIERYSMDEAITVSGNQTWTATLKNVNGSTDPDDDASDDSMDFNLNSVSAHPDKGVVVEEATGTWCTWCPRGTVFLDEMSKRMGKHFVGVGVHNSDPMELAAYDGAITSFPGFSGFPSVVYQRESIIDPSAIVNPTLADIQDAPPARLVVGAEVDGSGLTTSLQVQFLEDVSGADYSISIVLTEDGVSGTGAGWNQINAYSGGGQGPMGGYELLPGSVPGEFMIYDHVGRALIGGFEGVSDTIAGDFLTDDITGYVFGSYAVPAGYNMDNMHINGFLIDSNGEIINAISSTIDEAVVNGLFNPSVSTNDVYDNTLAEVYPNPVVDMANIHMVLNEASDIRISVMNAVGQQMSSSNYGTMSGEFNLEYNMSDLAPGVYFMHIQADDRFMTKKLTVVE